MARFEKQYQTNENAGIILEKIVEFLITSGYTKEKYNGEYVFKKGSGWFAAPKYITVGDIGENCIKLQAWTKWVLLPHIFIGEFDYTQNTFVGAIDKSKLKTLVESIDVIVSQNNVANQNNEEKTASWGEQWGAETSPIAVNDNSYREYSAVPTGDTANENPQKALNTALISKKEYMKKYAAENVRKDIRNAAITGYICSGLTLVLGTAMINPAGVFLGFIIAGLVLGFHLAKSKACAIIWLIIVSVDCIISLATIGKPSGWLMIVAGVWAVKALNRADKEYKAFRGEN